jgi:hypothetical protein
MSTEAAYQRSALEVDRRFHNPLAKETAGRQPILASGFRRELILDVHLREKSAFDLGGLGLSRVLSAPSRRRFSAEE